MALKRWKTPNPPFGEENTRRIASEYFKNTAKHAQIAWYATANDSRPTPEQENSILKNRHFFTFSTPRSTSWHTVTGDRQAGAEAVGRGGRPDVTNSSKNAQTSWMVSSEILAQA